jgi:hypothetical protein
MHQNIQETLELVKAAQKNAIPEEIAKAFTQSNSATTGLTFYDLEAPAKTLYPVITPLRNRIPRVGAGSGIQANWKAITAINTNRMRAGVSEGNRGGVIATAVADYAAAYRGIGLEDNVTFEADYAAAGFDDVRARATQGLLRSLMIAEEAIILGGNNSLALGTTPTPTLAGSGTGGSLATQTLSVICIALTLEAFLDASVVAGVPTSATRTLADGTTEAYNAGAAQKSSAATVSITGPNGSATGTVAAVAGAFGYAWFWGTAGNELIGAVTTINSVRITANAAGTQNASAHTATDRSRESKIFDGLLTMASTSALGSYRAVLPTGTPGTGTALTADGVGGVVEIDTALRWFWDTLRLSPTRILVNAQELDNITKKVLAGNSAPAHRFTFNANQSGINGGMLVTGYLNKFTMAGTQMIQIDLHPNMPPGTILFITEELPYPLSNVTDVMRIRTRRDYYQIEWPLRRRMYEYGVYADEVLQHYFPPSMGVITNIANG